MQNNYTKTTRRHCEERSDVAIPGGYHDITHNFLRLPRRARALLAMMVFCLASCDRQEKIDRSTAGGEAIYMARAIKHEIHAEYLNNYALDRVSKAKGLEQLALAYVQKKWQQNQEYIQEFGYECEKLGFKEFLEQQKLPCEKLNESPIFDHSLNSYVVKCIPEGSYSMWFDYDKKQWSVKL